MSNSNTFDIAINLTVRTDEGAAILADLKAIAKASADVQQGLAKAGDSADGFSKSVDTAKDSVKEAGKEVDKTGEKVGTLTKLFRQYKDLALAAAFTYVVKSGVDLNASLETTRARLIAFGMSADAAEDHVEHLRLIARSTAHSFDELARGAEVLRSMGVVGLTIDQLADISSETGKPIEQLAQILGKFYATASAGVIETEAIKPMRDMGVVSTETMTKILDLARSGASASAAIKLLNADLGRFQGSAVAMASTTKGSAVQTLNALQDSAARLMEPISEGISPALNRISEAMNNFPGDRFAALAWSVNGLLQLLSTLVSFLIENAEYVSFLALTYGISKARSAWVDFHSAHAAFFNTLKSGTGIIESTKAGITTLANSHAALAAAIVFSTGKYVEFLHAASAAGNAQADYEDSLERGRGQVAGVQHGLLRDGVRDEASWQKQVDFARRQAGDDRVPEGERQAWAGVVRTLEEHKTKLLEIGAAKKAQAAASAAEAKLEVERAKERKWADEALLENAKAQAALDEKAFDAKSDRQKLGIYKGRLAMLDVAYDVEAGKALTPERRLALGAIYETKKKELEALISDLEQKVSADDASRAGSRAEIEHQLKIAALKKAGNQDAVDAAEYEWRVQKRISELKKVYIDADGKTLEAMARTLEADMSKVERTGAAIASRYDFGDSMSKLGMFVGPQVGSGLSIARDQLSVLRRIERNTSTQTAKFA